jgi:hypothetical protein
LFKVRFQIGVLSVPAPDKPAKPKACPDWSGAWSGQAVAGFDNFRPKRPSFVFGEPLIPV